MDITRMQSLVAFMDRLSRTARAGSQSIPLGTQVNRGEERTFEIGEPARIDVQIYTFRIKGLLYVQLRRCARLHPRGQLLYPDRLALTNKYSSPDGHSEIKAMFRTTDE